MASAADIYQFKYGDVLQVLISIFSLSLLFLAFMFLALCVMIGMDDRGCQCNRLFGCFFIMDFILDSATFIAMGTTGHTATQDVQTITTFLIWVNNLTFLSAIWLTGGCRALRNELRVMYLFGLWIVMGDDEKKQNEDCSHG